MTPQGRIDEPCVLETLKGCVVMLAFAGIVLLFGLVCVVAYSIATHW